MSRNLEIERDTTIDVRSATIRERRKSSFENEIIAGTTEQLALVDQQRKPERFAEKRGNRLANMNDTRSINTNAQLLTETSHVTRGYTFPSNYQFSMNVSTSQREREGEREPGLNREEERRSNFKRLAPVPSQTNENEVCRVSQRRTLGFEPNGPLTFQHLLIVVYQRFACADLPGSPDCWAKRKGCPRGAR